MPIPAIDIDNKIKTENTPKNNEKRRRQEPLFKTGKKRKERDEIKDILKKIIKNPIWLGISEMATLGGVQDKTIRRAIRAKDVKFKVIKNRYLVDLASTIIFLHKKTKLKNKLNEFGLGQYVEKWKK